jgi:hypothetical protein
LDGNAHLARITAWHGRATDLQFDDNPIDLDEEKSTLNRKVSPNNLLTTSFYVPFGSLCDDMSDPKDRHACNCQYGNLDQKGL